MSSRQPIDRAAIRHHLINSQGQVQLSNVPTRVAVEMISEGQISDPQEVLFRVYAGVSPLTLAVQLIDELMELLRGENDLSSQEAAARTLYIEGQYGITPKLDT